LILCKSYIARLISEKSHPETSESRALIDQELLLLRDEEDKEKPEEEEDLGKRTSYYAEENEKLTNCEPILSEIVGLVDHFNSYNRIQKVIDKSQLFSQGI
jgi:hypothetical protein